VFSALLKSDFKAIYKQVSFENVLKSIFNPSFHAVFLIRCATRCNNKFIYVLLRNLLISKHSIDVGMRTKIGGGLLLPHPVGIVIGDEVVIGEMCTIYQNCTLGNKSGYPEIGCNVTIYCNSVIVGALSVGDNSTIGACSFLDKSISDNVSFYNKR
jgi:serine O-acetyltransferase